MSDLREITHGAERLRAAMEGLCQPEQDIFRLWHFERCSITEIAHALAITDIEVQQAIVRARHHIKRAEELEALQ